MTTTCKNHDIRHLFLGFTFHFVLTRRHNITRHLRAINNAKSDPDKAAPKLFSPTTFKKFLLQVLEYWLSERITLYISTHNLKPNDGVGELWDL